MTQSPRDADQTHDAAHPALSWLTRFAFAGALILVIARAMLPQYLRDTEPVMPLAADAVAPPRAAGPAVGVMLDSLTLLCGLLVLLRAALDRHWRLLRAWSILPLALLAILAFASTLWSGDKFAAAVAGSTWLAAAALVFIFSQTVRSWSRLRVVAGVLAGLFLVNIAHGIIYRVVDLPSHREEFQRTKLEVFAARGWDPDSFVARNFESRLMQGQTGGFAASPNSYGATLVLLGFVMAGVAWQRWRDRSEPAWAVVLALALLPGAWMLWTTQSRTALAAAFLAALALLALFRLREWMSGHRRAVFAAGVLAVLAGVGLVVAIGLLTGTLPHDSLAFRWNYWTGAAGVFADSPIYGVGFGNFGDVYLAHRLPVAAEEVKDPHNLFVRFFTELGLIGGLLAIAWLAAFAWEQTRPATRPDDEHQPWPPAPILLKGLGTILVFALLLHIAAAIDFSANPYYVFLELVRRGLYGLLILGAIVLGCIRSANEPTVSTGPAPAMLAAIVAGLAAALLHAMVDVVVFETSVLVSFAALMGAATGIRAPESKTGRRRAVWPVTGLFAIGFTAFVLFYALPTVIAERNAARGDDLVRANRPAGAIAAYSEAADWSPVPNTAYYERLARSQALAGRAPGEIEQSLERAIEANPRAISERVLLAGLYGGGAFQPPRLAEAEELYAEAVDLNPNDMGLRTSYAQLLELTGQPQAALEQYRKVLKQNDQLNPDEPERLTAEQIEQVAGRIEALRAGGEDVPGEAA